MTESMMYKNKYTSQTLNEQPKLQPQAQLEPCIVILSQVEIDKAKHFKSFEEMFKGLDQM